MVVNLFRMAPAKSTNQNQNQDPPPPPPPPEAWQAVMAATNANTQLIMQILQERNQANQGNQGNNQNHFATLNQFLANGPKTFSNCVEATDADDWLVDLCKNFECSNVRPEDFVKFASFQLKDQAAEWFQQYKDSSSTSDHTSTSGILVLLESLYCRMVPAVQGFQRWTCYHLG